MAEYCDVFCEPAIFPLEKHGAFCRRRARGAAGCACTPISFRDSGGASLAAELRRRPRIIWSTPAARGIEALQSAGVQPVLLPASVYALGSARYPDAREMIEAGLAVVLATDFNPGSSPTPSMPMILSLAARK